VTTARCRYQARIAHPAQISPVTSSNTQIRKIIDCSTIVAVVSIGDDEQVGRRRPPGAR